MLVSSRGSPISIRIHNPSPSSPNFDVRLRNFRRLNKDSCSISQLNRNSDFSGQKLSEIRGISSAAMDARSIAPSSSSMMLTSGASGRISAIFTLRVMRSLLMLMHAFILLLLVPFRSRPKRSVGSMALSVLEKEMDEKKQGEGGGGSSTQSSRRDGSAVLRVPSLWRKAATVVDEEVAHRRKLAKRRVLQDDDQTCVREFSLFPTARGDTLFTQSWSPVDVRVRGLVVLMHGLNEHSGRYNVFAKKLNANGFKVYAMDWIGHGGSDGLHAFVHSLDAAVSDLKVFFEKVTADNPGLPCFFFGHSTGGAIILKAALDPKVSARAAGLVLTSPAVGVQPAHPIYTVLAPIVSFLLPRYEVSTANKKGMPVSRDPAALVEKYTDPLVYTGSIRVRTGYEILRVASYLQRNLTKLKVPFFVLHGTADTVTDPEASLKLYEEASSIDKTIKLYDGYLHDLLFEPEKEAIADDIIQWLNSRVQ